MKKWGKRIGIALVVLVALIGVAVGTAFGVSLNKQGQVYEVEGATFAIPSDPESIAEGERLFVTRGCGGTDCHAMDGGGHVMMQDGPFGTITAANLTTATGDYTPADWDRAVRHGMQPRRDVADLHAVPRLRAHERPRARPHRGLHPDPAHRAARAAAERRRLARAHHRSRRRLPPLPRRRHRPRGGLAARSRSPEGRSSTAATSRASAWAATASSSRAGPSRGRRPSSACRST
ncbi:MAG: hypothetical protein M5U28_06170 [Sandaracinaceae bacterium]|nr:hypothetical protein [Sandaracinaceae bacterium]